MQISKTYHLCLNDRFVYHICHLVKFKKAQPVKFCRFNLKCQMINSRCVLKAGHMPGWNIGCIVVVPYLTIVSYNWLSSRDCQFGGAQRHPRDAQGASEVARAPPIELQQGSGGAGPGFFWVILLPRTHFYNRVHFFLAIYDCYKMTIFRHLFHFILYGMKKRVIRFWSF